MTPENLDIKSGLGPDTCPSCVQGPSPWRFAWFQEPAGGRLRWGWVEPEKGQRGTLLLFIGRTEYLEKYNELACEWRDRHFGVLALEWRGQGLSDRFLDNHMKCHIPNYGVFSSDFEAWYEAVVRPRQAGPLVLHAHSMGGLIALSALARQPERFAAAVLTVPMVAITTTPWPLCIARLLTRVACALGWRESYAFGQRDYDHEREARFAGNPLTRDPERFGRIHDGFRQDVRLRVGGVTFGWLAASFREHRALLERRILRRISTPVLLLTAGRDPLVPPEAQRRLGDKLSQCVTRCYPEARHDPLSEGDAIRACVWADIDEFINLTLSSPRL